jgi:hypothetical protein
MSSNFTKVTLPISTSAEVLEEEETEVVDEAPVKIKQRKSLQGFMDRFKTNLIELFKEEEDTKF